MLTIATVSNDLLEHAYAQVPAPQSTGLPLPVLKGAIALAARSRRALAMAVLGINALSPADRVLFDQAVELPPVVTRNLSEPFAWPTPLPPETLGDPATIDLAALAQRRIIEITEHAETAVWPLMPGRERLAMTYLRKAEEAREVLAATAPDPADYPHIAAEIGVTAPDLVGVAQAVLAKAAAWSAANAEIERARQAHQQAVAAATDVAAIEAATATARDAIDAAVAAIAG